MNSSSICEDLYNELEDQRLFGRVHSVFNNSFNISLNYNKLITVLGPDKSMNPNSLKLSEKVSFKDLNIEQGEELEFYDGNIHFKNIDLNISYNRAIMWDSNPKLNFPKDTIDNILIKLDVMKHYLLLNGNKDGILPLLIEEEKPLKKELEFIKARFIDFIEAFKEERVNDISYKAEKIVGFGMGLTPSMDDFLVGLMAANIYSSYYLGLDLSDKLKFNKEIVKNIANKTTKISEAMLELASVARVSDDIRKLLVFFYGRQDNFDYLQLLDNIVGFGHSSGTDILCGIYLGSYINLHEREAISK